MNSIPLVSWSDSVRRSLGEAQCAFEEFRDAIDPFQRSLGAGDCGSSQSKQCYFPWLQESLLGWLVKR